jgi:hypothetical protein
LIAHGKGFAEYNQAFYDGYLDWLGKNPYATIDDFARFRREWQKNNSLKTFIENSAANTPVRGDLPMRSDGSINEGQLKNGWQYVVDTPEAKSVSRDGRLLFPNGFIGRWNKEKNDFLEVRPL